MRTTLDLPDQLLLRAKTVALQRRITLKTLFTEALENALDSSEFDTRPRLEAPPIRSRDPIPALTNEQMEEILQAEEIKKAL
ncbi:MAG: hypothetical protein H7A53_12830 [Akkermansiaceae bacterium]|nr:hypothetical protein [Akkermansiaceae bacterium]MCP5551766.1 hypothetical protein [Akkermansiaceae bacterium]